MAKEITPDYYKYLSFLSWKMYKKEGKEDYNTFVPMKICERKDFQGAEFYFDRLEKLQKNSLLCIDKFDQFYLEGDPENGEKDWEYFALVVTKCAGMPHCETDDKKYEQFLKTFVIEINYISDKINFKKYG